MGKLVDFKCEDRIFVGIRPEFAEEHGWKLPDLYKNAEAMAEASIAIKEAGRASVCKLPFDTAVLAENLGAVLKYDMSPLGPRKDTDLLEKVEDVLDLPAVDPGRGRMAEILKACRIVMEKGYQPMLEIRGVFDTMNSLIDIQKVVTAFAMDREVMQKTCDKIRKDLEIYFVAAEKAGCRLCAYSDSTGGLNVLGPRFARKITEAFTYPLMKDLEEMLSVCTTVQMCPKTAFMLTGCDKAQWMYKKIEAGKTYMEAYMESNDVRFAGAICNNDLGRQVSGRIAYLKLA